MESLERTSKKRMVQFLVTTDMPLCLFLEICVAKSVLNTHLQSYISITCFLVVNIAVV